MGGVNITKININSKIYDLVKSYPEIKEIMKSLGFESIINPAMLNTAGRVMTIKKGAAMKKVSLEVIINTFKEYNFELEDNNE